MTSTRIIAADGTRYFAQGTNRRLITRIIAGIAIFIGLIIVSAAMIGFYRAATADTVTPPPASSFETLHAAESANPHLTCHIEWATDDYEVICSR